MSFIGLSFPAENLALFALLLAAENPQMSFNQMHERLRQELLRRIQRGSLSVSLLARQTGYGQSHISNFLRYRRQLSLEAMDKILAAQHLTPSELLRIPTPSKADASGSSCRIPVVSYAVALHEAFVRPSAVRTMFQVPAAFIEGLEARAPAYRRSWQRFVAIEVMHADALPMLPVLQPGATVLIDRHFVSLAGYRADRPNLYAVRDDAHLKLRYADHQCGRLVLRPYNRSYRIELMEARTGETLSDLIAGRVVLVLNEM